MDLEKAEIKDDKAPIPRSWYLWGDLGQKQPILDSAAWKSFPQSSKPLTAIKALFPFSQARYLISQSQKDSAVVLVLFSSSSASPAAMCSCQIILTFFGQVLPCYTSFPRQRPGTPLSSTFLASPPKRSLTKPVHILQGPAQLPAPSQGRPSFPVPRPLYPNLTVLPSDEDLMVW